MSSPRQAFSRAMRISSGDDFKRIYARRVRTDLGWAVLHAAENDRGITRLGLSVGARAGGAPQRNRIKRLAREAFRTVHPRLPAGLDLVLSARGPVDRPLCDYLAAFEGESPRLAAQLARHR